MEYERASCGCFTGHRAMTAEQITSVSALLRGRVASLARQGVVNFYAGGALGFDLAASVTVLNLKAEIPTLTLNLALPCPDYEKKWKNSDKELFARVVSRADSVVYVSPSYTNFCMQLRNRYMVDRSSVCVAYMTEESGGTVNTVAYARKKGIRVINLADPAGEQLTFEGL